MISNSVAIVDINPKELNISNRIESINYFWRPGVSDGLPTSIFSDTDLFTAYKNSLLGNKKQDKSIGQPEKVRFWPFSALSVSSPNAELKLLVVGQLVKHSDDTGVMPDILSTMMDGNGLSFVEIASVAAVVSNPYDPPSMWHTTPLVLNFSRKYSDRFRWYDMICMLYYVMVII
jgi:hypothetical protein